MASKPPGLCCTLGSIHEGTPVGEYSTINEVDVYVTGNKAAKDVLLILPDVLGHKFKNVQLLADQYAKSAGYFVIVVDLFNGDPLPFGYQPSSLGPWLAHHPAEDVSKILDKVLAYVHKELQPTNLYAVGFCFGGKYVVRLLKDTLTAGAICHPSLVTIEEIREINRPLIILGAETDPIYTEQLRAETEQVLAELKKEYFLTRASGTEHGFALRGDIKSDKVVKRAKEKAFADIVWWFTEHAK